MTAHFLICIFYCKIFARNSTEFCDLSFSNLHIFILKYCWDIPQNSMHDLTFSGISQQYFKIKYVNGMGRKV